MCPARGLRAHGGRPRDPARCSGDEVARGASRPRPCVVHQLVGKCLPGLAEARATCGARMKLGWSSPSSTLPSRGGSRSGTLFTRAMVAPASRSTASAGAVAGCSVHGWVKPGRRTCACSESRSRAKTRWSEVIGSSSGEEGLEVCQQQVGRLLGDEVAAGQRMAAHVLGLVAPGGQHVEQGVHLARLAPDGQHRAAHPP